MKKYCITITSILVLVMGIISCSNEETKKQNQVAARPTIPIQQNTVTDIDGNIYKIVIIGNQSWTQTNLNVSRYRNGDLIPQIQNESLWADFYWQNLTTGAWCYYENQTENGIEYGKLYNWYAVNDPRGLAPNGYHVPTDTEWNTLVTHLGGASVAGGKMKATFLWASPNGGATNSSRFTGLPGGNRDNNGTFDRVELDGVWWSSSESATQGAWMRAIGFVNGSIGRAGFHKTFGYSVRCIKN